MDDDSPLPWPIPFEVWNASVLAWLEARRDQPWAVAFSGGCDSLALTASVVSEARRRGHTVLVLHFNHCLRGAESDGDEVFVREWCVRHDVDLRTGRWDNVPAAASEGEAREARNAFFAEALASLGACALFTGHHADDAVETMLLRLARGSGADGLAAPRPVHAHGSGQVRLRPLLDLPRSMIVATVRGAGEPWREDSSNARRAAQRNRLRHDVVEKWIQASDRDVHSGVLRSRQLLEEDAVALDAWATRVGRAALVDPENIALSTLAEVPAAVLRRVLHRWAPARGLSSEGFERLLAVCSVGEGRVSLAEGFAEAGAGQLRWVRKPVSTNLPTPVRLGAGDVVDWMGGHVGYETVPSTPDRLARVIAGEVDPADEAWLCNPPEQLTLRGWAPGDRYRPLGLGGTAKVQDLFVNKHVPVENRSRIPLVCDPEGEVVWIPGFPPSETRRIHAGCRVLGRLTYRTGTYTLSKQS